MLVATTAMTMITRERKRLEVWDMERLLLGCCEWLFSDPTCKIGDVHTQLSGNNNLTVAAELRSSNLGISG